MNEMPLRPTLTVRECTEVRVALLNICTTQKNLGFQGQAQGWKLKWTFGEVEICTPSVEVGYYVGGLKVVPAERLRGTI